MYCVQLQVVGNDFCHLGRASEGGSSVAVSPGPALLPSLLSEKEKGRRMGEKKALKNIAKGSGVKGSRSQKSLAPSFVVCLLQQSLLNC